MSNPIYTEYPSTISKTIGLISIPHAGLTIPEDFRLFLIDDNYILNRDVDYAVDQLIDIKELNQIGVHIIVANVHRACLDLNRPANTAPLNWKENTHGEKLVIQEPDHSTKVALIKKYHTPYYQRLAQLIENPNHPHPFSVIDLHSMPSRPTEHHLKQNPKQQQQRPELCISDWKGISCTPQYIDFVMDQLQSNQLHPAKNDPYFGGFLTQFMANLRCNNIQIEINRQLYMNEVEQVTIPEKVEILKKRLTTTLINTFTHFA